LPVGGISDPVTTRFGLHLIQVIDRRKTTIDNRQLREQARSILREQKFEQAFAEWLRDLRAAPTSNCGTRRSSGAKTVRTRGSASGSTSSSTDR
jgi:Parvulin-like peptidyl-prolyl isomerase